MAFDPEFQKKLQIFLVAAIVLAGGRAAYILYERHEALKDETKPKGETALKADYYVTPRKLRPYDLKSARQLIEHPLWVKVGYQFTYYPYDRERHKTDFGHEAGTMRFRLERKKVATSRFIPTTFSSSKIRAIFTSTGPRMSGRELTLMKCRRG